MTQRPSSQLAPWISAHFDLAPMQEASLVRAYTNDVYLVETDDDRYMLKIYGAGWRHDSEIGFEADLLDHLAARGILVAQTVAGRNGDALQHLSHDGEPRQAVLFAYAAGRKPMPPFTPAMYHREGRAVAALHRATDDFRTVHQRRPLDLRTLIDRPLTMVASLDINVSVKRSILKFGRMVRLWIEALAVAGLDWGVCHGDLTFDNLHITDNGEFVWYDFDSGGYGWRAIDCQGWSALDFQWQPHWKAFFDGYRKVRPLGENDLAAAPYLAAASEIWGMHIGLERRILNEGPAAVRIYLGERADRFTAWRHALQSHDQSPSR